MIDIHLAAYFVLEESISALLDKNVNIESVDDSGQPDTALMGCRERP
jgi:hypothetical protein